MTKNKLFHKMMAGLMLIGMGGVNFQLSGCDQQVRSTVLGGLESATGALLNSLTSALFLSLELKGEDEDESLTGSSI